MSVSNLSLLLPTICFNLQLSTFNLNPKIIIGGKHEDARGTLRFCNDFDMSAVKRFYTISNSAEEPRRGWIMHKRETKWFFPVTGVTEVKVRGDGEQWKHCSSYVLSASEPSVLQVPPGHWFLIEQPDNQTIPPSEVMVFSNCRVGEFPNDDFRKDLHEEA